MTAPAVPSTGRIVHVSGDYPDSWQAAKTPVIRDLAALVAGRFDQEVISLNRVAPARGDLARMLLAPWRAAPRMEWREEHGLAALRYGAPGRGVLHRTLLEHLGEALAERLARGEKPALLVGHKLTIEGIAVARAASLLGVPYALSIQGNTDTRILAARPDLRPLLRRVFHGAQVVFPFAPWALRDVERHLGRRAGPTFLLPCPTALDVPLAPRVGGNGLASVFHLRNWKIKNLPRLAAAVSLARQGEPGLTLALVGGGSPGDCAAVEAIVRTSPGLVPEGPVPHERIAARLNRATGFAMPSLRESFGLVFVEALFAGCPMLYPRGRAVDGYFDGLPFAIGVDPASAAEIAEGLLRLHREEAALKAALATWQDSAHAASFRRDAIARTFAEGLALAMAGGEVPRQ